MIKVSLFASSVRPQLYESFFKSLEGTSVEYEVVFAGDKPTGKLDTHDYDESFEPRNYYNREYPNLVYIETSNIKPAQCYEIARRHCTGEVVVWVADDCEFGNDVIGKAYRYWKEQNNKKLILSIQTKEADAALGNLQLCNMRLHSFFGGRTNTPLMAPLGLMSREYLEELGGLDRRYVCGQYENDIVMRVCADGGQVIVFGDEKTNIEIDHKGKHGFQRPFATGYNKDREVLESSWSRNGQVTTKRYDEFEPYEDKDLLTKSQSNKGQW